MGKLRWASRRQGSTGKSRSLSAKIRSLGELKNQTLGTEDVTKAYFDTDARLKNAHVMEQRLIDMLKPRLASFRFASGGERIGPCPRRDREDAGRFKYWDSQVQFATVTMSLAEKDMEEPAASCSGSAHLALYAPDVERIYNEIKSLASSRSRGMQITNAQLNRDYSGRVSAQVSMLIAPEESDGVIGRVKVFGRVEKFPNPDPTHRAGAASRGRGIGKTPGPSVTRWNSTSPSHARNRSSFSATSLRIRTSSVDEKAKELRALAEKQGGRIRSSTFSRDPDGPCSRKCFATRTDEKLPGDHAIARLVRQS